MAKQPELRPLPTPDGDAAAYDSGYTDPGAEASVMYDDPVDLADIPERIPEGTYNFRITDAISGRSKKSDQPMVTLDCEVLDGAQRGQHLLEYLSFSPGALESTERKLSALLGRSMRVATSTGAIARMLRDRTFRARTKIEVYENARRPKIDVILGAARADLDDAVSGERPGKRGLDL